LAILDSKDSTMESPEKEKDEPYDEDDGQQDDKQNANTELFKTVCEQLSNIYIYDNNDETAINVSKSEEPPVT
jgi:hypothetical protein